MNKKILYLILLSFMISCNTQKVITEKDLHSSSENFGTFIWSKSKNDSIVFNKKNIGIITSKKGNYYRTFGRYIFFLIDKGNTIEALTFSERSKILIHLIYYSEIIHHNSLIESLIYDDEDLQYYNEFEKNNYYNLPNLKYEYRKKFEKFKPIKKLESKPVINIIDKSD